MAIASGLGAAEAVSISVSRLTHSNCFHNKSLSSSNRFYNHCPRGWKVRSNSAFSNVVASRSSSKPYLCRCSVSSDSEIGGDAGCCSDWDWNRWNRHFAEIEEAENLASVLKFQLKEAVEKEDFGEAAKLKRAIDETISKDNVAEIKSKLETAIDEERYNDASSLSRHTGSGLVGWWVGCSKKSDDPFGRLVHISAGVGRFIGRSYTPRQLVMSSPGTPLFEIYVVKENDDTYVMQVVCLQQRKNPMRNSFSAQLKSVIGPASQDTSLVATSVVDRMENEMKIDKITETGLDIDEATEEGIKRVINFLKDKIPELKVKAVNVDVTEIINDGHSIEKIVQDDDGGKSEPDSKTEVETVYVDEDESGGVVNEAAADANDEESDLDAKLFIGGVVLNAEDAASKGEYSRLPAEIKDVERNAFVLHVPGVGQYQDANETKTSKFEVETIAAQGVSELMPPDIAKAFLSADKVSAKISKEVCDIIKLAINQAHKRNRLSETTNFSRITMPQNDLDPFDGLYIGAFGPYWTELVQLKRKFGHWNADEKGMSNDLDFFEYVEAVKLTGDLNVPAGQVVFRAKIGKGMRNPNRGMHPDILGVVASYKGQGRIADFGFKNPRWVEGQLLQLNGKGVGPYAQGGGGVGGGADLGFLFSVPEKSFVVLFTRLKLPE